MSIITLQVDKGTFPWAVAMLQKGHVLKRHEDQESNCIWHYMMSPGQLLCRIVEPSGFITEWMNWKPNVHDFNAKDWRQL
jgi:hypothetical protein